MNPSELPVFSVKEHLKGFSAVNLPARHAADAMKNSLRDYGPVIELRISNFQDAIAYLLPIKSFTTRYLVFDKGNWSLLLTDMRGEGCYVDAYAISRATGCRAIGVFLQEERRELHLFEEGKPVRKIQSLLDGDRWYYREAGPLQPFEDPNECLRRRKRDRLRVEALARYFESYTGMKVPDWRDIPFPQIFGFERSLKNLRVPLICFETHLDL